MRAAGGRWVRVRALSNTRATRGALEPPPPPTFCVMRITHLTHFFASHSTPRRLSFTQWDAHTHFAFGWMCLAGSGVYNLCVHLGVPPFPKNLLPSCWLEGVHAARLHSLGVGALERKVTRTPQKWSSKWCWCSQSVAM